MILRGPGSGCFTRELALAAWNRLRLTPLLQTNYEAGARKLRRSIKAEIAVAAMILAGTAWIITASPHP